jgi:hypothetical protein
MLARSGLVRMVNALKSLNLREVSCIRARVLEASGP